MGAYRSEGGDFNPPPKPPAGLAQGGGGEANQSNGRTPKRPPRKPSTVQGLREAEEAAAEGGDEMMARGFAWVAAAAPSLAVR